jgi:hypothetical protein
MISADPGLRIISLKVNSKKMPRLSNIFQIEYFKLNHIWIQKFNMAKINGANENLVVELVKDYIDIALYKDIQKKIQIFRQIEN